MRIKEENKTTIDENEKTINKLRKELDEAKHSVKKNAGANAQDEVDELKNRLRKLVGANTNSANPNITDLSDENRPTKLSGKFSELFNNEWIDAYEEAENEFKTEDKRINHLYKTLLDVSEFCKIKTAEYVNGIRFSVTTLPNSSSASPNSVEIGVTSKRLLEEVGRSFAPKLVDMVFQSYSHEKKLNFTRKRTQKSLLESVLKSAG